MTIKKILGFIFFSILLTPFFIVFLAVVILVCFIAIPFSPVILYFSLIEHDDSIGVNKNVEQKKNEIRKKIYDRKSMPSR